MSPYAASTHNSAHGKNFLGVVTNLIPGLVESQSRFRVASAVTSMLQVGYSRKSSSIYSLGVFARVVAEGASTNVIVFGLVFR